MKPCRATEFYRRKIATHCASKRRGEGVLWPNFGGVEESSSERVNPKAVVRRITGTQGKAAQLQCFTTGKGKTFGLG